MRVAIVETSPLGGLLHYSAQLADALAERGHEVDLITARDNELVGTHRRATMRAVLTPPVRGSDVAPPGRVRGLLRRAAILGRLARTWPRAAWEVRRGGYDVVVLGDVALPPVTLAVLAMTALPGRPAIVEICHNVSDGAASRVSAPLLSRLFERADLVLVHGERPRAEFEATWPPTEAATIRHGDERIFGDEPPPAAPGEHILFFGNWRDVKGIGVLMDAFDELATRRPDAVLTLAGRPFPDSNPAAIRSWAARSDGRVRLIDRYIGVDEVRPLFSDARVVVAPYLQGSQSGVVHLAMTMARAVVASDVGEIGSTVADGETGFVVPPGDARALAAALEGIVADPERARRFGQAGRERLGRGSRWEDVAEQLEGHLERVVDERRGETASAVRAS